MTENDFNSYKTKQISKISNSDTIFRSCRILSLFAIMSLFFAIMAASEVSATTNTAAYVVKLNSYIKTDLINQLNLRGFTVTVVEDKYLNNFNLSSFTIVIFDEGSLPRSRLIDVTKYHSIIMNKEQGKIWGLCDADGVTAVTSTKPLSVIDRNNSLKQVYNQSKDGNAFIQMYYIKDSNQKIMLPLARINSTSPTNRFYDGTAVGIVPKGAKLTNGKYAKNTICFFGIINVKFWTENASSLFDRCISEIAVDFDQCNTDSDCNDYNVHTVDKCLAINGTKRCIYQNISCLNDEECGLPYFRGENFCDGKNIVRNLTSNICQNAGTVNSTCISITNPNFIEECDKACENGRCIDAICGNDFLEPGEECENNNQCKDTECDTLDGCVGDDYYDYNDVQNSCEGCGCTARTCAVPRIFKKDLRCISCVNDADCSFLNNRSCQANTIRISKGVCIDNKCQLSLSSGENCGLKKTIFNSCGDVTWTCAEELNEVSCIITNISPKDNYCAPICASQATLLTGKCMPSTYRCQYKPVSCTDGLSCNGIETCSGGRCQSPMGFESLC